MFDNTRLFDYLPTVIIPAILDTVTILFFSALFSITTGMILGFILFLSSPRGLRPNKFLYTFLSRITDTIRSFPTMILIVAIAPLTRLVMGSMIGVKPAIFAITMGCTPFAGRMTESAMHAVNHDLILAAKSFGAKDSQIIFKILLVEALPNLVDNFTIMLINMLNMSAMAGAVGAGGLGAVALTYGYQMFDNGVMYFTVLILMIFVFTIQSLGNIIKNKLL